MRLVASRPAPNIRWPRPDWQRAVKHLCGILVCAIALQAAVIGFENRSNRSPLPTATTAFAAGVSPYFVMSQAQAKAFHGGAGQCPYATDNGCAGSPGGSVIHPDFWTSYAAQSGQTFTARPQFNSVGIDYAGGMPAISKPGICGKDQMVAPENATVGTGCGQLPTGVTWLPSGQPTYTAGIPTIYVNGATNPIIQGFDLRENGNHGGVVILFNPTSNTGTLTARFNNCQVGANDSQCFYLPVGGSNDFMLYANSSDGGWYNYGTHAGITGSISGTTLTVTAVSYGTVAANQSVNDGTTGNGSTIVNTFVQTQTIGSNGNHCPDPSCNGGIGQYTISKSQTVASMSMTTGWHSVACTINTTGKVSGWYNSFTNFNGRPCQGQRTLSASGAYAQTPTDDWRFNYCENMVFTFDGGAIHGECWQGTVANGATGVMLLKHYEGNTCLLGKDTFGGGTTACWYPNTGVPSAQTNNTQTDFLRNVSINNTSAATGTPVSQTALASFGYDSWTNVTLQENWIYKGSGSFYVNCTNAPYASGAVQKATVTASVDQTPGVNTMHVTAWTGPFLMTVGWHVFNYGRYVLSQLSGGPPTGEAGDYSLSGAVANFSSGSVFAQPDAFVNAPVISGNTDPSTGANIDASILVPGVTMSNCQPPAN